MGVRRIGTPDKKYVGLFGEIELVILTVARHLLSAILIWVPPVVFRVKCNK